MTSWESSHKWYDALVGEKGHYYHEHVVLPHSLKLLDLKPGDSLLDLACGQGVLSRAIPKKVDYTGVDLSRSLIYQAQKKSPFPFHVADITQPLNLNRTFSHASLILAVQNLENFQAAFINAATHLKTMGKFLIVMNHPCFRIPRQSSWGIDEPKKLQYRRIDRYMQPLKIPIQTHPGQKNSSETWSFHHPLSAYTEALSQSGFAILQLQEWISDKQSTGGKAKMENRSRQEFPLFLALLTTKVSV